MQPIEITLASPHSLTGQPFPVAVGVPFSQGEVSLKSRFKCHLANTNEPLPTQLRPLGHWPDGSIRWLLVRCMVPAGETPNTRILLKPGAGPAPTRGPAVQPSTEPDGELHIRAGSHEFVLSPGTAGWRQRRAGSGKAGQQQARLQLLDADGTPLPLQQTHPWLLLEQGDVCSRLRTEGQFTQSGTKDRQFHLHIELTLYTSGLSAVQIRLHNPHRARHPGGLWDLGDPGSLHFRSLTLHLQTDSPGTPWLKPAHNQANCLEGGPLRIHQESSGGENWNSPNHQDARGQITPAFRGFECLRDQEPLLTGERATPLAGIDAGSRSIAVAMEDFWQNFPSAIAVRDDHIDIDLFPPIQAGPHELQGGERKTQAIYIEPNGQDAAALCAYAQPRARLAPEVCARAGAFPWFNPGMTDDPLQALIRKGLDGPHNFFRKREVIDEYGWRHFGDLFADHETLYQQAGERPFISHYNNQYDPVYGFARQFALTGDRRWHELMNDLARHVTDIDIYHTREDRVEYNNGLFWHTDHYLDAHTATHRTFSRHNSTSSTPGQTGGGPGAEHCYTTGLLYHYWMTGNQQSADAVLELAQWLENSFEHPGGLLGQMLALKKQELPRLKALLRGQAPLAHRYPFTRATGNYLNALLDAWLLTGDRHWLHRAETVIQHSIHPNDDPAQRNLLDVETGWSYLVLLTSITKYLWIKEQHGERDSHYAYARHALARYTRWMRQNEQPFLAQTEQLEYPNHTWTAQDVRKAMLLYLARYTDPDHASDYQQQADAWLQQTLDTLRQTPEAHYTRILVILMQNQGPQTLTENPGFSLTAPALTEEQAQASPRLTWPLLLRRIFQRAINGLLAFRPGKEKAWLQARLDR